jgi:hypothetical protein
VRNENGRQRGVAKAVSVVGQHDGDGILSRKLPDPTIFNIDFRQNITELLPNF